jgi:DNA invertase Pin-like site-specific DNA recombinase
MSQLETLPPNRISHPKLTPSHQQRWAYIYVRQSTLKQVAQNQESQVYQYRLQQRALELGWPEERIRVIDCDLGTSGSETTARTGFQNLVAEVSLGHVGIVFGYEVSRLARNNCDWYHLLDLAAMFNTLIADSDGIYDPQLYNDRLLLGLKGTMSEAELHLLRQRLDVGRMAQVKRGAYRQRLPTGYIRLSDDTVVKDPDDQVRDVIDLMFTQFDALGSVNRVLRYLRQHQILLPRRQNAGPQANQLLWKVASEAAITDMLHNPAYAGAFAYGRRQHESTRRDPGRPAAGYVRKPMDEWTHLQHDVYPAYISWEQYLANQERLRKNGLQFTEKQSQAQGIARDGAGLLQGMLRCGRCGHYLQVVYKSTPRYVCRGLARTTDAPSTCTSVRAPALDALVVEAFFNTIQPAQIDALDAVLASQRDEHDRLTRHWQEQLKRAEYEAHLAQRQYDAVDPENRLVAAELERRWETKLRQFQQTQEDYRHFELTPLPNCVPEHLREQFRDISARLPEIWPTLSNVQRKELLRSMISHVIVKRTVPDYIEIRIVWVSGYYSDHTTLTPIHREQDVSGHAEMVSRIHDLWQAGYNDAQMATQLTAEGFHSARSVAVTATHVMKIRLSQQWYLPLEQLRRGEEVEGYLTVNGLAERLAVNPSTVYRFIYKQVIAPEYIEHDSASGTYHIRNDAQLITRLHQRVIEQKQKNGMLKLTSLPE